MTVLIDIAHPRPSDLTVTLTSPMGTAIDLPPDGGSSGACVGEDVNGTWTLVVTDGQKNKEGTLNSWSLTVTPSGGAGGGSASYAPPDVATVGAAADAEDGVASLRRVKSPKPRTMEGPVSTLHLLLHSERETQEHRSTINRRGVADWHESNPEATDLALAELEGSLLRSRLSRLLASDGMF